MIDLPRWILYRLNTETEIRGVHGRPMRITRAGDWLLVPVTWDPWLSEVVLCLDAIDARYIEFK